MARRVVRERIDPRLTASLFANYRSATDALLELVDNAVDSRLPERPLTVEIAVHPGTVTITAVGGTGMSPGQLEREYLRWGASPKHAGERIGRYGQGGKAAIGHLGNRFVVVASPAGDHRAWAFEDPSIAIAAGSAATSSTNGRSRSTLSSATCGSRSARLTNGSIRAGSRPAWATPALEARAGAGRGRRPAGKGRPGRRLSSGG